MRCNNCGRERTRYDDEFCEECGVEFYGYYSWEREEIMAEYEGDLCCNGDNDIDNILECKRAKANIKRRGTYRIG